MATIALTEQNFVENIEAEGITLIDFWASWCGPCMSFGPVYEKVSEQFPEIRFTKVDTEAEQVIAGMFGIQSIPTVVVFRDGIPLFGQPGAMSESALIDFIQGAREVDMVEARRAFEEAQANFEKSQQGE